MAPAIVPSRVFGRFAPSNILQMGCIGVGRQGQGDMQELIYRGLDVGARVVAVCDVDRHRMEDAQWLAEKIYTTELDKGSYKGCAAYSDFRELLARKDIDGVLIVTPDHWHAVQAIAAADTGKDMYLEKPLTYSIAEGRKLVQAVRKNKRILQVGSQQRSSTYFLMACELVRNQRIGCLRTKAPGIRNRLLCPKTSITTSGSGLRLKPHSPSTACTRKETTAGRVGFRSNNTALA